MKEKIKIWWNVLKDQKKINWEKFFKKLEEKSFQNPFKNFPSGSFKCGYAYYCPQCLKPVFCCSCELKKFKPKSD